MPVKISFADLSHTGQVVAANSFPLGSGLVVAYAKEALGDEIDVEIFKYPDDFASRLDKGMPDFACFTSFSWNIALHNEYARRIKQANPNTITVFGGCNFPDEAEVQEEFLRKYDGIDFYVEFEGEVAFLELYRNLKEVGFDAGRFKRERRQSPNVRYLADDKLVRCELGPKIRDLSTVPSPYLTGILDKFFDDVLIPLLQTARGCPYNCTFCWEGGSFFSKVSRFTQERIRAEIDYIAQRVGKVPDLHIIDANFGMFKEDLDTAHALQEVQKKYKNGWPKSLMTQTAKNNKERTMEIVELLGDTMPATAAVQTTDQDVLDTIKRKNPPIALMEAMGRVVDKQGGQTEGEIVLCLPGDNRPAHFKSVADLLDIGMTFIRMYQYMLLPGSESAQRQSRREHEMVVRYRVLPRCFGHYRFGAETFGIAEIEEIVVGNKTMPHPDYEACRDLNLTVEIFNNDSIFLDLMLFLERYGIKRSAFINQAYDLISGGTGIISRLYGEFRAEEQKNLWDDLGKLEQFTRPPGIIDRYISGEYGTNELYKYRALAVFEHIAPLHDVAFAAARALLDGAGHLDEDVDDYLTELQRFSLMRKEDTLNTALEHRGVFHYDFVQLLDNHFMMDPFSVRMPEGMDIAIAHSDPQKILVDGYVKQYGTTLIGRGRILIRANMGRLYRSAAALDCNGTAGRFTKLPTPEMAGRFSAVGANLPGQKS